MQLTKIIKIGIFVVLIIMVLLLGAVIILHPEAQITSLR
jgi:hypothetical protein